MGARAVPLAELTTENTEVRGFNGRATVNCGFSLPIIRHQPTGLYCALSVTRTPGPVWSTEEEIREFEVLGRLTLLSGTERIVPTTEWDQAVTYAPEPIPLPDDWNATPRKQPVVIWVKSMFLHHLSMREQHLSYTYSAFARWYRTAFPQTGQQEDPYGTFYVGCTDIRKSEYVLNLWGQQAKHGFDERLARQLTRNILDWLTLEWVADAGLCAARDHGLRYWLYVRYCAALYFGSRQPGFEPEPERAYRIFQVFVQAAYQGVTWERFCEEMFVIVRRAHDVRRLAAVEHGAVSPPVE
jgi:hypothetical protein